MRRRRNRVKEAAALAAGIIALATAAFVFRAVVTMGMPPKYQPTYSVKYTVQKGDTIWNIAEEVANDTSNHEIYLIQRDNMLGNTYIMPGQTLYIPVRNQ